MKNEIIFPMAVYVLFMWISTVLMFRTRVRGIKKGEISLNYYRAHIGQQPPERAILVGRHFDNQFQVPILFFITCILHIEIGHLNYLTVILAWSFVISRFVHSWILLGKNVLRLRAGVFAFGWIVILGLWIQLLYFVLQ